MNSTASGGDGTRSSPWSGWQGLVGLCLIASIAIGSFVVMSAKLNHAVNPPLDDSYIYYQYAKQIARGQLFRYQDGDQVSTGSSSILYPILVAPFWLAGMRDKAIFWGGFYVNAVGLLLAVAFLYAALRRLLRHDLKLAWLGALLLVANGWFLWGVASGMDIGLFAGGLAFALHAAVLFFEERRRWPLAVALGIFAVCRPEGLVLAWTWALVAAIWGRPASAPGSAPAAPPGEPGGSTRWPGRLVAASLDAWPLWVGVICGTLPTLLLAIASGHLSTNTMVLKSHWSHEIGLARYLDIACRTLFAFPDRMLWTPAAVLRAPMIIATVAGLAGLWRGVCSPADPGDGAPGRSSGVGAVVLSGWVALLAFYGLFMPATEQHNRYYMLYAPLVALTVTVGASTLALAFPAALQATLRRALLALLVVIGLATIPHWAKNYAGDCEALADQHVVMATWMRHNLRDDVVVGINDAGALAYLGERRVVDLLGLVTNKLRAPGHWRAEGHMWEQLERLKATHLVIYPAFFDDVHRMPGLKRVHTVNINRDSLLGDKEKVAYDIEWSKLTSPDRPLSLPAAQATWKLVDMVDIADLDSEADHAYRVDHGEVLAGARWRLRSFAYGPKIVVDGGRAYTGGERFVARVHAGKPLLLGLRADFHLEHTIAVSVDGRPQPPWELGQPSHRRDQEAYLLVPSSAVTSDRVRIEVRLDAEKESLALSVYHWFVLQP
jgi:hypothetical protein